MPLTYDSNKGCSYLRQPLFFLLLSFFFISSNCSSPQDEETETLFKVNDIEVTVFDFETKYVKHLINTGRNDTKTERYSFLNQLIDNIVLADQSSKEGFLDHSVYKAALNFQRRKSMVDAYFVDEMDNVIEAPTDAEVRLAYAKKQRKVFVRHLFSLKESELVEPYQRLESGESFVDVANDYYETPAYDSTAGYLGPISYFGVDDAFADAAFSTNQGEYTKPIRSKLGYHIIYVEYIEFPGMLTEDDYQYRKAGVTSQVRLRKQSLISNEYIRNLMGTLLVEIDSDEIIKLKDVINNLSEFSVTTVTPQEEQQSSDFWNDGRLNELKASFDENTMLATFVLSGERVEFTFGDYVKWLPYLSFSESKNKTGASIGRGLRNEVLYRLAEKNDYENNEGVLNSVKLRGIEVLSELYQSQLTYEALLDTQSVLVPTSFRDRLVKNRNFQMIATYWKILASSVDEAENIKDDIDSNGLPMSYDSYESFNEKDILPTDKDYNLVNDALLNRSLIGFTKGDEWIVLNVQERDIIEITSDSGKGLLEKRYKVFKYLDDEVVELRKEAEIKVDTLLFNDIYDLTKKKEE